MSKRIPYSRRVPTMRVWLVTMNREITPEEYAMLRPALDAKSRRKPTSLEDKWRDYIAEVLPNVVMHHRNEERQWEYRTLETSGGKQYFVANDNATPSGNAVGFSVSQAQSLVGIAFSFGPPTDVVNTGLDIIRVPSLQEIDDAGLLIEAYSHKLTPLELSFLQDKNNPEVAIRRLFILLAAKQAYIRALGQPSAIDFSRLEFNIPESTVYVDGEPLTGWEFRLFRANIGVSRSGQLVKESYQCCGAIYRGGHRSKFFWNENEQEMSRWLNFVTVDQLIQYEAYHMTKEGKKQQQQQQQKMKSRGDKVDHDFEAPHLHRPRYMSVDSQMH